MAVSDWAELVGALSRWPKVVETVSPVSQFIEALNYSVNNGASQDVLNGRKEIWPQVLEKAVATLDGGYGAIANGGNPMIALQELTGRAASTSP